MKNITFTGIIIAASMLLSACDPQPARQKPAQGGGMRGPKADPTETIDTKPKAEKKKEPKLESETPSTTDETPKAENKTPSPVANPEYGKKADGKVGFIESPYAPGKLIDVRALPPGTEIECPYTKKPLLVP